MLLQRKDWRVQFSIAMLISWQLTAFPAVNAGSLTKSSGVREQGIPKPMLAMFHGQVMEPPWAPASL